MTPPGWTRERVVEAIQAFHQRTGRWPVAGDCRRSQGLPAVLTVQRLWGTLEAARQAAGMPAGALGKKGAAFAKAWPGTQCRED